MLVSSKKKSVFSNKYCNIPLFRAYTYVHTYTLKGISTYIFKYLQNYLQTYIHTFLKTMTIEVNSLVNNTTKGTEYIALPNQIIDIP